MTSSTTLSDVQADVTEAATAENRDRALPRQPARAKSSVATSRAEIPGERSDDYNRVVVMLDARTRVIAADIQWIIQRRGKAARNPWRNELYFRTREGLVLYAPKPTALELLRLPDRFPERGAGAWDAMWSRPFHRPELL